ncbi:MAG: extracellular solute-binding protein [Vicinamibacterales bacterium]
MRNPAAALIALIVAAGCAPGVSRSTADRPPPADLCRMEPPTGSRRVTVLAWRFAATEHLTNEMRACGEVPGLDVEVQMLPPEQVKRQSDLAMSSGAISPFDIIHTNPDKLAGQAASGWVLPLDALVSRYRAQYQLDDIPQSFWNAFTIGGHIYAVPFIGNAQVLFYRRDLFEQYGVTPPATLADWYAAAERLAHIPEVKYPLAIPLRGNALTQEFSNALLASGGRWYDEHNQPAFAGDAGVRAVETLGRLRDLGPRPMLSFTNDDVMVALLQNQVAMALMWLSRGVEMGNPQISNVVGRIGYAATPVAVPGGVPYGSLGFDGWMIPANARDPELSFRIIMEGSDAASMRGAAAYAVPARGAIAGAPDVLRLFPWLLAGRENVARGAAALPAVPSFGPMGTAIQPVLARGLANRLPAATIVAEMDRAVRILLAEQASAGREP